MLNYKTEFGEHGLTLTGGVFTASLFSAILTGQAVAKPYTTGTALLPIPDDQRFWYMTNGFENPAQPTTSSTQYENSTVSWSGRALYNYKQKYYLNASFRSDGSSQIPVKNRYQTSWAVGAAWEITREIL